VRPDRGSRPLVVHVVGARPNFMKAAPVIRALDDQAVDQRMVHTGQHYDDAMSGVFFRDLGLPRPDEDLGVGSGSHASQTAAIMVALERSFTASAPDLVIVYGDVNSTMAAAIVAAKLDIMLAHVEAGLRSFDDTMPEEVNRRVTDLLSDMLFVTSPEGVDNLRATGVPNARIHFVGNPMIDTLLAHRSAFDPDRMRSDLDLPPRYAVATIHRPSNVDDAGSRAAVVEMLERVAARLPIVVPLHPRGRAAFDAGGLRSTPDLRVVEPLGYLDFLSLVHGATVVITDSGGIQEETTILGIPCLTIRSNTERPITISHGTNRLTTPGAVPAAVDAILEDEFVPPPEAPPGWDGRAGQRIAAIVARQLGVDGRGPAARHAGAGKEAARLSSS
jgi:UDP-N-acetylglucosamine 2-epimerase (non-hydrolysing)